MRRREFIKVIAGSAAAWPLVARAQESGRTYRIGFLVPVARDEPPIVALLDELRIHGFVEGQNLAILPVGFQARNEQVEELVSAMIKAAPDAILSGGDPHHAYSPEGDPNHTAYSHYRGHGGGGICRLASPARRQHYRNQPDVPRT
jgi:hypothetical protein